MKGTILGVRDLSSKDLVVRLKVFLAQRRKNMMARIQRKVIVDDDVMQSVIDYDAEDLQRSLIKLLSSRPRALKEI